jgi:hypothetical protein
MKISFPTEAIMTKSALNPTVPPDCPAPIATLLASNTSLLLPTLISACRSGNTAASNWAASVLVEEGETSIRDALMSDAIESGGFTDPNTLRHLRVTRFAVRPADPSIAAFEWEAAEADIQRLAKAPTGLSAADLLALTVFPATEPHPLTTMRAASQTARGAIVASSTGSPMLRLAAALCMVDAPDRRWYEFEPADDTSTAELRELLKARQVPEELVDSIEFAPKGEINAVAVAHCLIYADLLLAEFQSPVATVDPALDGSIERIETAWSLDLGGVPTVLGLPLAPLVRHAKIGKVAVAEVLQRDTGLRTQLYNLALLSPEVLLVIAIERADRRLATRDVPVPFLLNAPALGDIGQFVSAGVDPGRIGTVIGLCRPLMADVAQAIVAKMVQLH